MSYYFVLRTDGTAAVIESAEYPSMANLSSCSGGCDTVEELRACNGLQDSCSLCTQPYSTRYTDDVKSVMLKKNICFSCWFWTENIQPGGLVIDGHHYTAKIEAKTLARFRGMGGRIFRIRKNDGTEIVTNDLWHQGTIPAHLRSRYPDNAVFMDEAGYVDNGDGTGYFNSSEGAR